MYFFTVNNNRVDLILIMPEVNNWWRGLLDGLMDTRVILVNKSTIILLNWLKLLLLQLRNQRMSKSFINLLIGLIRLHLIVINNLISLLNCFLLHHYKQLLHFSLCQILWPVLIFFKIVLRIWSWFACKLKNFLKKLLWYSQFRHLLIDIFWNRLLMWWRVFRWYKLGLLFTYLFQYPRVSLLEVEGVHRQFLLSFLSFLIDN